MSGQPLNDTNVLKNGLPTIAVLAGAMTSNYHEGIVRGVAHVAAEKNYNVLIYCGGVLSSSDPLTLAREKIFNLVDMDLIAGVISPFSSHMRFLNTQQSQQFIDRFSTVPVINIGSFISNHTNVVTDYEAGFNELFEHFYHYHGYRNILLVRGPEHHASSEKRMQIYKDLLRKYNLPFDEQMVIYSNLNRGSAKLKIEEFLDTVNRPFDAIITVNDNQALGIIDVFQDRGIRVPEDVAVVGSMNTLEGAFSTPALTSIEEPPFDLGKAAAIELIKQIEGKQATPEIHIPSSLIVRQSCGCETAPYSASHQKQDECFTQPMTIDDDPICRETKEFSYNIVEQYKGGIIREEVERVLALYQEAIYKNEFDAFLMQLQNILHKALRSEDIMLWLAITTKLQLSTLRYLTLKTDQQALMKFVTQLISLKNEIEQVAIKFQRFESEYYLNYFRSIVNNLNSSFDLTTIKKYTVDILQLSELYISIFNDLHADVLTASNMVAVRNNKFIELNTKDYVAKNLLPNEIQNYQERFTLMVFPLSFRSKPIGFMALNLSNRKGAAFENLRAVISSALKNEMLIQDLKKAEERFSDIAHSTSNWLWETDIDNKFTYCSNSSNDIIGYSPEALFGLKINNLNVDGGDSYIKRMLSHEDLVDVECWCQHQDGNVICLLIAAKPIITEGVFTGYRGVFEDITEKKLQAEKIKNLAYSDILTGLPNRALFQEKLDEVIAFSAAKSKKFALMFIDLDHFKHINDSMGHAAGDILLIKLAKRLTQSIRSNDILARLGGDEFIIILPNIVNEADIIEIAQRIFDNLKDPIIVNDKPIYSTLSLGISVYPIDGVDAQSLLKTGDNAMYQAKSQGRNGFVFYDKILEEKNAIRGLHEEILHEALATNGFIVQYQPQVSVETGNLLGFEALVRIESAEHGIVPPNNFIPLAEELGLISQVDEWVFNAVCAQYSAWRKLGLSPTRLSINLSAIQLRNTAVLETYIKIIEHLSFRT